MKTTTQISFNIYISLGVIAFMISFMLTPLIKIIAVKLNFIDKPDSKRKLHSSPKALLGGLAIYISFLITLLYSYKYLDSFNSILKERNFYGLIIGTFLMLLIGLIDDFFNIPAFLKLFLQIVPAVILYYYDFKIDILTNPISGETIKLNQYISFFLTIGWVLALTNSINLIDGMDGLASGITVIGCLTLFAIALNRGSQDIISAVFTMVLLGSVAGFIKYNFPPASIFMGDTGSLFIGYTLSAIGILGINKSTTAIALMVPIAAVGIPIYDTFFAIFRRTKRGVKIFKADSEHIHHRLLKMGLSQRQTLLLLYGLSIYFGVIAFSFLKIPNQMALIVLVFFILSIIIMATYLKRKEIKITIRKKEQEHLNKK